jgi:hypothetical protein
MKKYLFIIIFFSTGLLFSQSFDVYECSNDFIQIKKAFQEWVHELSSKYRYFFSQEDKSGTEESLFEYSEIINQEPYRRKIRDYRYFIFKVSFEQDIIFLFDRENSKAIIFMFLNEWDEDVKRCSEAEINNALTLYQLK